MSHRRFVWGIGGTCLGSGLLAVSFLIDPLLLGPFTTLALGGAVIATLGAAVSAYTAQSNPESFDFDDGVPQQLPLPTLVLIMGIGSLVAGLTNLTLAVVG